MKEVQYIFIIDRKETDNTDRNFEEEEKYFIFPTEKEINAAQAACCGKCCDACETPAAYAWRKRDVDLSLLLEKAIENELSDTEKRVVREYWYNSKKTADIALENGISLSAVSASLERAREKLHRVLRYTVMYQHCIADESIVPAAVRRAAAISASRHGSGGTSGERLRKLRLGENLSGRAVSQALGMTQYRLFAAEKDTAELTASELISLSSFFGVTADYILKGDTYDKKSL